MSEKTTRSSIGSKNKISTQPPTKKTISKPSNVQDRPNSRVPSRIIVSNNPVKPKEVENKSVKTVNVNSKVNVQTKTRTQTQTPTRPTIVTRPKTKVISKPNVTQTSTQNTGSKIHERRLSRVETKTATKSRPTLSKTVVIQSNNSVKESVNGDKAKERVKTVDKRSIVVNESKPNLEEDSIGTGEDDITTEADYSDDFEDYESDFEEYESQDEVEVKSTEVSLSTETNKSIDSRKVKLTELIVPSITKLNEQNNQQPKSVTSDEEAPRIKWEITLPSPKVNINEEIDKNKESLKKQINFKDETSDVANVLSQLFGPKNIRHSFSQTIEKSEASCQSDEIHVNNKSIQCPARSSTSNICDQSKIVIDNNIDILRLSHFLEIGEKITKNLITSNTHGVQHKIERTANLNNTTRITKSDIPIISYQFPESYKTFKLNNLVTDGRYVYSVTSYDFASGIYLGNSGSVVMIWSLLEPRSCEFLLFCKFMLTQIVTDNEFLVVAGSSDGSLIAWDLREPSHFHNQMNKSFLKYNTNHPLRMPSFTTAVGKHADHHQDRILQLFHRYEINDDMEARRIISLDESGKIIVWLIVESYADDHSSQQVTDGLRPGSCVRLQIAMTLNLPSNYISPEASITCIDCSPSDSWNYLIGTNLGSILRYSKYLENLSDPMEVVKYTYLSDGIYYPTTCVVYHPSPESDLFLAGYMDGSICIFSIKYEFPSRIFLAEDTGYSTIISSFWLSMDSELFLILDHTKGISIRDAKGENKSLFEHQNANERILFVTKSLINLDEYFLVYGSEDSSIVGLNMSNHILNG